MANDRSKDNVVRMKSTDQLIGELSAKAEKEGKHRSAEKLADQAIVTDCWIYDRQRKEWYTPSEFVSLYQYSFADDPIFKRVEIKNPLEGMEQGYSKLADLQNRLFQFSRRVMAYYANRKK